LIILTKTGREKDPIFSFRDAWDPVQALLSTRSARATISVDQARRTLKRQMVTPNSETLAKADRARIVLLKNQGYSLALGWELSQVTLYLIQSQNGVPTRCDPGEGFVQQNSSGFDADCVYRAVEAELGIDTDVR